MITTALTILALAVASWSLYVMTRQLTIARSASGGRALIFTAGITGTPENPPRVERDDQGNIGGLAIAPAYRVRLAVGGPGILDHVSVHLVDEGEGGYELPDPPPPRISMTSADKPIEWDFALPPGASADNLWAIATWREPYLEGIRSQAVARWLTGHDLYLLHLYRPWSIRLRRTISNWAKRHPRLSWNSLRQKPIYGKWKRRTPPNALDIRGTIGVPPRT